MSDSNSLEKKFSEFDTNNTTNSTATDDLLYPEHENYEYRRIRNAVICHGKLSKEDASAILLQKTYRMYRIHRYFANYYKQFQHVKKVTMRPYFIAFVLNSHATNCDRRKLYETQFSRALFCKKLFRGFTHPPFEVFTVTDQCLLPPYIDCSVLSQFVKKIYRSLILRAFLEWRIIARKQVLERKNRANKDIDIIKRQIFGNEYVCFNLWYRYTKRKLKKKMNAGARIPQWDYYMNLINKKNAKYQKSLEIRLTTIKKTAIQALLNRVIERREEENVLIEADKFRIKRNMIFALSAWAHYIVIQHNRVNTLRAILREWFCIIQQQIHFRALLKKFQPRHSYFTKRAVFSAFIKNRQISQITSTYIYCKIQTKPSLALYFLAVLTHDKDVEPFYLAMHAWVSLYRRRKKWQHFIFQDLKTSNYDVARQKALTVLRKQDQTVTSPTHSNFISPHFQQDTLFLYEYVMKMKTEYETIFLLSSDEEAKDEVANSESTAEQRRLFFKMWLGMKAEPTLIMRLAAINLNRRRAEKANETMKQGERTLSAYHKAVTFLESYNMASEEKFRILRKTIDENNRRALANRTRCIHRDRMIIYAHYSHFDAESLKIVKPLFKTNDKLKIVSKIKEATTELTESFQSLINVAGLGISLHEPNMFSFSNLVGCKAPIQPFNIDHKTLQTKFLTQMKKGKISPITQIQFERLMAGSVNETAYRNLRTYQRLDPYATPLIESKPPPVSGVNLRLLQVFPMKGRKPIRVGSHKKKKVNFSVFNQQKGEEEEEEDTFDGFDEIGIGNFRRPGIINAYDKSKGSMFFNSLKSFANIISQSSFAIFGPPTESTIGMDISHISVPIEEVDEDGLSDSESERESQRSNQTDKAKSKLGLLNKPNFSFANENKEEMMDENDDNDGDLGDLENDQSSKNEETKQEKKPVAFRGLNEGFDEELMKSINKSNPPRSPDATNKAKLFIEILFGRASRNIISVPMMNLKKRLIQELKNQKEGSRIPGILTQETVMPIANLLDLYHQERDKGIDLIDVDENSPDNDNSKQHENTSQKTSGRTDLYTISYRSKRYRPLPKKERPHKEPQLFEKNDDDKIEEEEKQENQEKNQDNEIIIDQENQPNDDIDNINTNNKLNVQEEEDNNDDFEYEYEYETDSETGTRKKKRIRKKKQQSKEVNKESSRIKKDKTKNSNKDANSKRRNSKSKNKTETTTGNKHSKKNKEKGEETKSGRKTKRTKGKKHKKVKNGVEEYEYESESEEEGISDQNNKSTTNNLDEFSSSSRMLDSSRDNQLNNSDSDENNENNQAKVEINEKNEEDENDTFQQLDETDTSISNYESSDRLPPGTASSQNSRLSSNSSKKSREINTVTPYISIDKKNISQNPLAGVDKLVFSYLKKNLEEEEQLDLVDLDGDDERQKSLKEQRISMLQKRNRLWRPPRFSNAFNPHHHRSPLINNSSGFSKPIIIIKDEKSVTPSMRQTLKEESSISKLLYHNGKTVIKPAQKTSNSLSKPILNSYLDNSSIFDKSSSRSIIISKIDGNIKLDKSISNENSRFEQDQVVTFGGGGRGISEEALNLQRIRMLRTKQLLCRQERKKNRKQIEFDSSASTSMSTLPKSKKAKEYEDLSTDFSNLRTIVTQLIQMMASSRDDSNEFETLRKRAKFLRKKPSFVGLEMPNKLKPDQFYNKMQSIFMKYMRKKNAQATANELFQVMKDNLEFAPIIIRIIDKTANEERRYIDSKLQRTRLGKQPTEQDNAVHFIDLDWMSSIPDYNSVALQYKFGFDQPKNLDAIVAPTKENDKSKSNRFVNRKYRRNQFNFASPSYTNWDRTLEKFELQDLIMISNWVPEQLIDEVIADHNNINIRKSHIAPENK